MVAEFAKIERSKESVPVELPGISDVSGRAKEIHDLIAQRAYAIYEGRGHVDGHDFEDWLQAESEVRVILFVGLMEVNGDLSIDIGITALELRQLRVCIEPLRMIVSGKRNVLDDRMEQGDLGSQGERPTPVEIFSVVDFPVQVEPSGAKATFSNGLLEVRIPASECKSLAAKAA